MTHPVILYKINFIWFATRRRIISSTNLPGNTLEECKWVKFAIIQSENWKLHKSASL